MCANYTNRLLCRSLGWLDTCSKSSMAPLGFFGGDSCSSDDVQALPRSQCPLARFSEPYIHGIWLFSYEVYRHICENDKVTAACMKQ